MQFAIPYRNRALPSVYGEATSRANFCEEDFIVTGWIGEFANTLTNIAYVIFAVQGLRRLRRENAPASARFLYYGLIMVGGCSALFHALLKYHAQMADDLSMQVASATVLHRAFTFDKSAEYTRNFTWLLILVTGFETGYHSAADEQTVHELFFAALIIAVAIKTRYLIRARVSRSEDRGMLTRLVVFGVGAFLFGYLLWNLDFIYCSELTSLKRAVGMPWGFVFEFHGWWHILTAVGAYVFMVMVECLTSPKVEFTGPLFAWAK